MNNDLEQFSEERLKELEYLGLNARLDLKPSEGISLIRIALAVKQAKPVAQVYQPANIGICAALGPAIRMINVGLPVGTLLYTTPQPAHAEHGIPSEIPKVPHNGVMAYKKDGSIYSTNYARGWNDCVQAMLAAAPKPESE